MTIEDDRYPVEGSTVRATMKKWTMFKQDGDDVYVRDVSTVDLNGWVAPFMVDITMAEKRSVEWESNYLIIKKQLQK